jgi:Spy/CpxP family protein refolding chaperone
MSNNINRLFLGTTLILILFSFRANTAWAKPTIIEDEGSQVEYLAQNSPRRRGNELGGKRILQQLNLTTEQQEKMQQIRQKYQPEVSQIQDDLRSQRNQLREMMTGNESTANLRSQHQKIVSLDQQLHNLRFESMLEMREVLTLEQRQKFATAMEQQWQNFRRRLNPE